MASQGEHAQLSRIAELERQGDVQAAEQAAAHWRARAERASALLPRCRAHILASRAAVELAFSGLATARSIDPDPNPNPNPDPDPNPKTNPNPKPNPRPSPNRVTLTLNLALTRTLTLALTLTLTLTR